MNARFTGPWRASITLVLVTVATGFATAQESPRTRAEPGVLQVQRVAPVLAGSVFKLAYGDRISVPVAGASVFLHPADSLDDKSWIGPNLTDAYGRFTFQGPATGRYLMRIFSGSMRLWEQTVQLPTKLDPIVVRDVRVVYYPKSADSAIVLAVLEKLAFPFDKAVSVNAIPTNTMWFGDRVSVSDVKTIAGALLRGGVNLRAIRRFHDGSDWRAKVIEIGANPKRITGAALDPKDVDASKDFPRD